MPSPAAARTRLALPLALLLLTVAGCGTVMNQVGTLAARVMTGSTSDLAEINYMVTYSDQAAPGSPSNRSGAMRCRASSSGARLETQLGLAGQGSNPADEPCVGSKLLAYRAPRRAESGSRSTRTMTQ